MKSKLLLSGLALVSLTATAQQLHDGDIQWPNSQTLYQYVNYWTPGQPLRVTSAENSSPVQTGGIEFEDENFFISRVRIKPYFRNLATQVRDSLTEDVDKKLVNWVPINKANDGHTDGLPNGLFDSEVFSNWSYVTHWGDWIAPHGWVPGSFADAAHKHGTIVSGVASVPYGSIGSEWSAALTGLANMDNSDASKEKLAKFLYYHGVNGLGYNSEFSGYSSTNLTKIQNVHKYLMKWMDEKGVKFENMWYDGTDDTGYIKFDQGLSTHNDGNFSGSALFWNYNWNGATKIQNAINYAKGMNPPRSSLDLYAGHNMQGGEPGVKNGNQNWSMLARYPISIGLWGAHNTNLLWAGRSANGSAPISMQDTYQKRNEQWFTNAVRNPVIKMRVYDRAKFSPDANWFGMSSYMSARSSLCWDLNDEPFITYFNLGNGMFLNWAGERQNDNEWYNIGVQDYMPTWRWWFTTKFLGKTAADVPQTGLDAQFTWNDAYMGGSCLNIYGTTPDEYLHLYKTRFALTAGDVITVRYKLLKGATTAKLVFSTEGAETTPIAYELFDGTQEPDDEWVEKVITIGARDGLNGRTIAMIALQFTGAEDLNLYLGELSIIRGTTPTPKAPKIKSSKILRNNYYGVDAKLVFEMENDKAADEPCYNLDVNTSLFKLYARIGNEIKLMGLTTSWAGIYFSIPVGDAPNVRLGVSAVSTDMKSESNITWTSPLQVGTREVSNEIVVSKNIIKPDEDFTVGYLDAQHEPADWELTNANTGEVVKTATGTLGLEFPEGLSDIAPYNLKVTEANKEVRQFNWLVQITGEETGALPKIYDIKLNEGNDPVSIETGESVEVSYTGRNADGSATRAISAEEKWIGGRMGNTGLELSNLGTSGASFTVAAWIRYDFADTGGSSAFFSIEDRTVAWPQNNWGWFWSNINPNGALGSFTFRTSYTGGSTEIKYTFADTKIPMGLWTHVAIVFDYQSNTVMRAQLYINGIKQKSTWIAGSKTGTTDDYFTYPNGVFRPEAGQWFSFFGGRGEGKKNNMSG